MGSQKRYREKFFSDHPTCCFCGGIRKSEEIEHMPSRIMFIEKHRPRGLEFPACKKCNDSTRKSEPIVAFFALSMSAEKNVKYRSHMDKLIDHIKRYDRRVLDEIIAGRIYGIKKEKAINNTYKSDYRILNMGEKSKKHIHIFNKKMSIALFYNKTSIILNENARVAIHLHSYFDFISENPPKFPTYLGNFDTLRQGGWNVADQFQYRYVLAVDNKAAIFQFVYHNNMVSTCFVVQDHSMVKDKGSDWEPPNLEAVSITEKMPILSTWADYTIKP